MIKPKIAILLEFGFHEIKKYIHSGFATELGEELDIVWFAVDKGSKEFHDYFVSTGFPIVYFNESDFKKGRTSIEQYNQIVRRNWIANKELGGFHNHSKVRTKSLKTKIIGSSVAKFLIEKVALKRIQKDYISATIEKQLTDHSIDQLFLTGYDSSFAKSFVTTGVSMNKKVHYLVNSWKDLYINNFVPFNALTTIFVWSEQMLQDFKYHMPYLKDANFVVSGNPTFDILLNATPIQSRAFYAEKYKLPIKSKWILYTMMPVGLVLDEIDTIIYTANEIQKHFSTEEVNILVRKNPTHNSDDFKTLELPGNLKITDHYCTFDKVKDMIVQSPEGEKEWIDLLLYSEMNLSVPSTVTLEFLALEKPILNIAYNSKNEIDSRVTQFFEAGFYKPLFIKKQAAYCKNSTELISEIKLLLTKDLILNTGGIVKKRASTIIIENL